MWLCLNDVEKDVRSVPERSGTRRSATQLRKDLRRATVPPARAPCIVTVPQPLDTSITTVATMAPINTSLPTVRTATVFITSSNCIDASTFPNHLSDACDKASALREALTSAGVDLQTTRVAVPGPAAFGSREAAIEAARALDAAPVDYASLGTVHPSDDHSFLDASFFTDVLSLTSKVFVSLTVTSSIGEPSHMATRLAAETISRLASLELSGLANMRFAALANVRAGCPFFPAAYAPSTSDASPSFPVALGVQAAPLLHAGPLHELPARVEKGARELVDACKVAGAVTLDFSTAPLPGMSTSAAAAVARSAGAGVLGFGKPGTLAAAAAVASKLDEAKFPRAGLCGVMLPVAEDSALAFCDRPLRLNDLLLASAVCGTGLDVGSSLLVA